MKVYYEKPTAEKLINAAIKLACDYEVLTGKVPNKIEMTKEEIDVIDKYFKQYIGYQESKDKSDHLVLFGMDVVIK